MLPVLVYKNMQEGSNSLNNASGSGYNFLYDQSVILNSVRSRKKVTELPNCPVCSCTIRQGELESHLHLEMEKLNKLSAGGSKRKLSANSSGGSTLAMPGSSTSPDVPDDEEFDASGSAGGEVYQRVHDNRIRRLRARRRATPPPDPPLEGQCPVCNETFPTYKLQRHALRCLKRTGADIDDDVADETSDEDCSIDVENDEPEYGGGGSFGAEYQWCGQWRVRASALVEPSSTAPHTVTKQTAPDCPLVVDGDEDTELYGPPQYSPSRIAPEPDPPSIEDTNGTDTNGIDTNDTDTNSTENSSTTPEDEVAVAPKPVGLVEASAETRIQALKARIRELESKQGASDIKCLICLSAHIAPAVSIQCWHVHCEQCWLQSLRAKKICPQCNVITTTQHLRRVYL